MSVPESNDDADLNIGVEVILHWWVMFRGGTTGCNDPRMAVSYRPALSFSYVRRVRRGDGIIWIDDAERLFIHNAGTTKRYDSDRYLIWNWWRVVFELF